VVIGHTQTELLEAREFESEKLDEGDVEVIDVHS